MSIFNALVGLALLLFGRKAFWLFVAGAGFVAGVSLASRLLNGPDWLNLVIGIGVGLVAALIAVFLQQFAIGLAAFLIGGYITLNLMPLLNLDHSWLPWLGFIIGGLIGVALVGAFLDWALILLSSLAGASLLIQAINLRDTLRVVVFILLIVVGVSVQARELRRDRHRS